MSLLWLIIIILLVLALFGGAFGHGMGWGYYGWSPLLGLLLVLLLLYALGVLRP